MQTIERELSREDAGEWTYEELARVVYSNESSTRAQRSSVGRAITCLRYQRIVRVRNDDADSRVRRVSLMGPRLAVHAAVEKLFVEAPEGGQPASGTDACQSLGDEGRAPHIWRLKMPMISAQSSVHLSFVGRPARSERGSVGGVGRDAGASGEGVQNALVRRQEDWDRCMALRLVVGELLLNYTDFAASIKSGRWYPLVRNRTIRFAEFESLLARTLPVEHHGAVSSAHQMMATIASQGGPRSEMSLADRRLAALALHAAQEGLDALYCHTDPPAGLCRRPGS
jgi:hypothetical protein